MLTEMLCSGLMLLDSTLQPIAFNAEAVAIFSFPAKPDNITDASQFLGEVVKSKLLLKGKKGEPQFVTEYFSEQGRYNCRVLSLRALLKSQSESELSVALILEPSCSDDLALQQLAHEYRLTSREVETVALLVEGLTSKEIANRMNISANTVKAFIRRVMLKLNTTTRSGIVGKLASLRS
jgi:DNA-binding CsgD family transcriptional regulator